MTKLSVNINKIATLRNSRGEDNPNVVKVALDCERFGAEGITVHPRPDERHIRYQDVYDLKSVLTTEFNIEGYPSEKFVNMVQMVKPTQVTLVPDAPDAITSNAGWDCKENAAFLYDLVARFHETGVRVSIFVGTDILNIEAAAKTGTDRIELYTEPYDKQFVINPEEAVKPFVEAAQKARVLGLGVNAGHDLNLRNLSFLRQSIPFLEEVSIGHALICDALYLGLEETIKRYKQQLL
ncbi:MAG TPA: pyridoxine 5'-phosphate synthase [Paludibacteraceae bacterium]|nr:pyridoxine 5'-phosphate synthase [Paludibacteraceae bacterium]HOO24516.1 pyridoxine 5'-phosphate synthase [Paludibacteraceae bacterium]HOS37845.1 pyridoxine 5'-phosphate synthase [Paludibacteraceae bacterium]HPK20824.1 pyridoxine 5'-phosphate synthase [Paludibacteraceae bacterium]